MGKIINLLLLAFVMIAPASAQPNSQMMDSLNRLTGLDYRNMLDQLHITSLRPGANGNDPKSLNAANYDEAKANPYSSLLDPLVMNNGQKVISEQMWWEKRRPEIVEYFDKDIYGQVPKNMPIVNWQVIQVIRDTVEGIPVITKKLTGHVDNSSFPSISVDMSLTLTLPANANHPIPVIMEFGFVFPAGFHFPQMASVAVSSKEPSWQQQVLGKGWGYAILLPNSIQADYGAGLRKGIIGLMNKGNYRKPDDWGTLRAWAWGASRVMDYFETDAGVNAKQVGIMGHSRYGKAALVAMAYDPRFAIAYISSSGEAGAKLYRHIMGETVENIANQSEYHWMAGNFLRYAGPLTTADLPIDANELIALCAPRPVFIGGGSKGDDWVDTRGMFMATVDAGSVYKLLGKKSLGTDVFPPIETSLLDGELAFRQHRGGHTPVPNWPYFIQFANRYFK